MPVFFFGALPTTRSPERLHEVGVVRRGRRTRPGSPRRNDIAWVLPSRSTSTSSRDGQGVDDRRADAVQTAGRRVGAAAELAAGVQPGHDDLDAGQAGLRLDVDRDAATVVAHLDEPSACRRDVDPVAVAGERLVDGVVDDLPQAVHEAAGVGGADVHARALADRLEPLEHRQVLGGVAATPGRAGRLASSAAAGRRGRRRAGAGVGRGTAAGAEERAAGTSRGYLAGPTG